LSSHDAPTGVDATTFRRTRFYSPPNDGAVTEDPEVIRRREEAEDEQLLRSPFLPASGSVVEALPVIIVQVYKLLSSI